MITKQEQIKKVENQIKKLEQENKNLDGKSERLRSEWDREEKPYQNKIAVISKAFSDKIEPIEKNMDSNEDIISNLNTKINNLGLEIEVDKSKKSKRHTVVTIEALYDRLNFGRIDSVIEKKPLGNGIQIFRFLDGCSYSMWLAFDGLRLVGLSYRRAGDHRGDTTYPYSYIGGLRDKNLAKSFKESMYGSGKEKVNSTFTQWSVKLEKRKLSALKEIKLDAKTINCIGDRKSLDNEEWRW